MSNTECPVEETGAKYYIPCGLPVRYTGRVVEATSFPVGGSDLEKIIFDKFAGTVFGIYRCPNGHEVYRPQNVRVLLNRSRVG
jgi:hypothetical protein